MDNKYNFQYFIARSQRVAGFLMMQGHKLIEIKPDEQAIYRNVFVFANNKQLIEHLNEYKQQQQQSV